MGQIEPKIRIALKLLVGKKDLIEWGIEKIEELGRKGLFKLF